MSSTKEDTTIFLGAGFVTLLALCIPAYFVAGKIVNYKPNPHLFNAEIIQILYDNKADTCPDNVNYITQVRLEGTEQIREYACVYLGEVGDIVTVYVP